MNLRLTSSAGSKVHMAVDTLGHLLVLHVTPADVGDRAAVGRLVADIQDATSDSVRLAYVPIRTTSARQPQMPPQPRVSRCMSSNCQTQSAASSCCPDAGL